MKAPSRTSLLVAILLLLTGLGTGMPPRVVSSPGASQGSSTNLIPLYVVDDGYVTWTISRREADAAVARDLAVGITSNIKTCYVPKSNSPGTVPLHRLRDRQGLNFYTLVDSQKDILVSDYGFQYLGLLAYVYPARRPFPRGMYYVNITQGSHDPNLVLGVGFLCWKTSEGSRGAAAEPPRATTRRSLGELARRPPDPVWFGTPEPVYVSNDCGASNCVDKVNSYVVEIPDGYAYVDHVIERTTENPHGEGNGKWRICHGKIPGPDGRVKGVWIEVLAGSRNTHGPRVWIGANLKVVTQPGQQSPICEGCSTVIGCKRDRQSPISSGCRLEGAGRVLTFQNGGIGTSISEMSVTNGDTGEVALREWANTTDGGQNAIHFAATCQEAGVRCCLIGETVYMYGRHGYRVKGAPVSVKDF